jgi:DNA replication protein DnaC
MMRDANNPTATIERIPEDRVLDRSCVGCGEAVRLTIPAGTVARVAAFVARMQPECEACVARREAEEQLAEGRRLRRQRVDAAGMPPALRGLSWESYKLDRPGGREAVRAAVAWARGEAPKRGLLVSGPVGVGKTRLAATAAWELMLRRDVRWVSVPDLIIRLGASFGDADRARAMKVLTGRGALVLDDLDKIKPSTWVLNNLFTAIDARYQAGAPLLVTTNLAVSELAAYFAGRDDPERKIAADAIVSRLWEHCVVGRIEGRDRRRG